MSKRLLGEIELNRIYQRDCIKGMRMIPDNSVDMVLCDLPYGTAAVAATRLNRHFIGFETEREYVEIANKRLDSVVRGEGLAKEETDGDDI